MGVAYVVGTEAHLKPKHRWGAVLGDDCIDPVKAASCCELRRRDLPQTSGLVEPHGCIERLVEAAAVKRGDVA